MTSADLPEAYFLAGFLESRAQRFAIVNIVGRPLATQLRVLARLRRNRGTRYVADLLLARAADLALAPAYRWSGRQPTGAFPEIDAPLVRRIRATHPRIDCTDPHAPHVLEFVGAFRPDYVLLAGAPILKPSFYGLARHGALNRHLGLLPDFRGSDCAIWAFAVNCPERAGYTVHVVNERVDAGDIVVRRAVPVQGDASFGDYLRRLQRQASTSFVGVIDGLLRGVPLPRAPQDGHGQYFPPAGWSALQRARRNYVRAVTRRQAETPAHVPATDVMAPDTRTRQPQAR